VIVVDASVALKWSIVEPGREDALRVLDTAEELVAPDLIFAEVTNVLRKKTESGQVTREQSVAALEGLRAALGRTVPAAHLWPEALELSLTLSHPAYDCFYLAASIGTGMLISADEKFIAKVRKAGLGRFVSAPRELPADLRALVAAPLPGGITAEVGRLAAIMEQTFNSLGGVGATGAGQFRFVPASAYRPAFDSPAYRRLAAILKGLPSEHLASLLALGWLGRSYHHPDEWPLLLANAQDMAAAGFERHASYFMAQMADVERGLEKLRSAGNAH
jgi:predicted nucleic acid-binding protein